MNILKQHLIPIVSGVIALVALAAYFWPLPGWVESLQTTIKDTLYQSEGQAKKLGAQEIRIPTGFPGQPDFVYNGPAVPRASIVKKAILDYTSRQANDLARECAKLNRLGRVNEYGVPLLGGTAYPKLLPVTDVNAVDPNKFKHAYLAYCEQLFRTLTFAPDATDDPNTLTTADYFYICDAPTEQDVQAAIEAERLHLQSGAVRLPDGFGGAAAGQLPPAEILRVRRRIASNRAASRLMYGSLVAFPIRQMAFAPAAPSEKDIFDAFIDSCILTNVANAISALNHDSTSVASSPVKRLLLIAIGAEAANTNIPPVPNITSSAVGGPTVSYAGTTGAGPLFVSQSSAAPRTPGVASSTIAPPPSGQEIDFDFARSFTGRVGSIHFDVTHVRIIADMTPSALNQFVNQLYLQSNSYTVLNIRSITAVDPIEAASTGYLYGNTPVIRVDMLVEALFFRDWTKPIMPSFYRDSLHVEPAADSIPRSSIFGR